MKRNRFSGQVSLFFLVGILHLGACSGPPPTEACHLIPQQTGEKIIPIAMGTPPPPHAPPGATLRFSFSGGYRILHMAEICSGDQPTGYVYADELAGYSQDRSVTVWLDGEQLTEMECGFECVIQLELPSNNGMDVYQLRVRPVSSYEEWVFEVEIVE